MRPLSSQGGHSAKVKMQLLMNGDTVAISQMGPDFLLIDEPLDHEPTEATLLLAVDESEDRWKVYLPKGIKKGESRVEIETIRDLP